MEPVRLWSTQRHQVARKKGCSPKEGVLNRQPMTSVTSGFYLPKLFPPFEAGHEHFAWVMETGSFPIPPSFFSSDRSPPEGLQVHGTPTSQRRGVSTPSPSTLALKLGVVLNRAGQALSWWSDWFFSFNPVNLMLPLGTLNNAHQSLTSTHLISIWEIDVWGWMHYYPGVDSQQCLWIKIDYLGSHLHELLKSR